VAESGRRRDRGPALLPILLGGWLPLLNPLAIASHCWRWPLLGTVIASALLVTTFAERFHDVRVYQSPYWQSAQLSGGKTRDVEHARQLLLTEAIDAWMAANNCTGEDCPWVILVAAEGGGSRAAFLTATVLGALLDVTRGDPARYREFGRSVFAMSGVSGGSVGLTFARTALMEMPEGGAPPCRRGDPLWFGFGSAGRDVTKSWRACLQALAAGDFLSPTIAGLIFRDNIAIPAPIRRGVLFSDRAVLLEQAMERHYNGIVHGSQTECGGAEDERGLCQALGYLGKTMHARWSPLLFLNATSVDTGRQIIASDMDFAYASPRSEQAAFYQFSYNVSAHSPHQFPVS
jgi:hypothetical protein